MASTRRVASTAANAVRRVPCGICRAASARYASVRTQESTQAIHPHTYIHTYLSTYISLREQAMDGMGWDAHASYVFMVHTAEWIPARLHPSCLWSGPGFRVWPSVGRDVLIAYQYMHRGQRWHVRGPAPLNRACGSWLVLLSMCSSDMTRASPSSELLEEDLLTTTTTLPTITCSGVRCCSCAYVGTSLATRQPQSAAAILPVDLPVCPVLGMPSGPGSGRWPRRIHVRGRSGARHGPDAG